MSQQDRPRRFLDYQTPSTERKGSTVADVLSLSIGLLAGVVLVAPMLAGLLPLHIRLPSIGELFFVVVWIFLPLCGSVVGFIVAVKWGEAERFLHDLGIIVNIIVLAAMLSMVGPPGVALLAQFVRSLLLLSIVL